MDNFDAEVMKGMAVSKVTLVESEDSIGLPEDLDFQLDAVLLNICIYLQTTPTFCIQSVIFE